MQTIAGVPIAHTNKTLSRLSLLIRELCVILLLLDLYVSQAWSVSAITSDGTLGTKVSQAGTTYNITDGTMVETPQLMPSINGLGKFATNADGSVDLWFGPQKPADAPVTNWIQTVDGRNFLVALRLYGTGVEFFDQTWKPDDVVKVE